MEKGAYKLYEFKDVPSLQNDWFVPVSALSEIKEKILKTLDLLAKNLKDGYVWSQEERESYEDSIKFLTTFNFRNHN